MLTFSIDGSWWNHHNDGVTDEPEEKPLAWVGSCQKDLRAFPDEVKDEVGFALYLAQTGGKHEHAKPLKGFGGAGVLEVVENHDGDTYRAVYTVKFPTAVYVLHAFQKKSTKGGATPKPDLDVIETRLATAAADHARQVAKSKQEKPADERQRHRDRPRK
jgi:phage-related protein